MLRCAICLKDCSLSKLKTIGDQTVCSLSCIGLLKSNSKDSCDYCKRPVWKDNYFKINNKNYCSEICKNKIIKKLNIPNNSKSIINIHENIFLDNNDNMILKNSQQLREEVLKFYKDFHFDIINNEDDNHTNEIQNLNIDNYLSNNNSNNNFIKIITTKDNKNRKSNVKIEKNIINTFKYTPSKDVNNNFLISNDNRSKKYALSKALTSKSNLKFKTRIYIKDNPPLNKNYNYITISNKNNDNLKLRNVRDFSQENLSYNLNKYHNLNNNDESQKNYSFIKTMNIDNDNDNIIKKFIPLKERDSFSKNEFSYKDLNKIKINPSLINDQKNQCMNCGKKLGNAKFLDRNKNTFCSYTCKEQFHKKNN